jgi:DNA-binding transcriptional ArsR family regulator
MNNEETNNSSAAEGLQKFPNLGKYYTPQLDACLAPFVKNGKITLEDIINLPEEARESIRWILTAGILSLAGEDREAFIENTEEAYSEEVRSEIWERNHKIIIQAVDYHYRQEGKMPSITKIAQTTKLSRVTVGRHLKEYYDSVAYKDKEHQYKFLREALLAKVYDAAYYGDMKAAKIFLEASSPVQPRQKIKNQQNNFIQVNGITITEEQIRQMPQEQQMKLFELLKLLR